MGFLMKKIILLVTLMLLSASVIAQGLTDVTYGYTQNGYDAKTLAMQNIGTAAGVSVASILINPAAVKDSKLAVSASYGGFRLEERRSFPVYDRFDGVITQGTYVINSHKYGNFSLFLQSNYFKKYMGLNVGVFSAPFISFRYDYKEYVRDNTYGDPVLGFNKIHSEGLWRVNGINFAFVPMAKLTVGANIGLISESEEFSFEVVTDHFDEAEEDLYSYTRASLDNTPFLMQFGARYEYNERWSFGLQMKLPVSVEMVADNPLKPFSLATYGDSSVAVSYSYPLEISGGFLYQAQTPFRTRLYIDYGYRFWSAVTHDIGERYYENLNNTFYIGTALEFTYLHENTFTFSYKYGNSPKDNSFTLSSFALGIGFPVPHGFINMATGISQRSYTEEDLFPDSLFGGDRSNSTSDDVQEDFLFGKIGFVLYLN